MPINLCVTKVPSQIWTINYLLIKLYIGDALKYILNMY